MKRLIILVFSLALLGSCISLKPKDFTYQYKNEYTGLDTLININGYYSSQRECDSTFYSIYFFYPNGLFTIATGTDLSEVVKCFEDKDRKSAVCDYPSWGVYRMVDDTIKTQTVRQEGIGFCTIFRDYKIEKDKSIVNISDYVIPENSNLAYMANYPSFRESRCQEVAKLYPLAEKRDSTRCPYLKKKWFVD